MRVSSSSVGEAVASLRPELRVPTLVASIPANEPAPPARPGIDTIDTAAARLGIAPNALRARCRRASRRSTQGIVADLGGGIVAFKFGKSWRVRFPAF